MKFAISIFLILSSQFCFAEDTFFVGNSLSWDCRLIALPDNNAWHIACNRNLSQTATDPDYVCVPSATPWPVLFENQYDQLTLQPFRSVSVESEIAAIEFFMALQPGATVVIHPGWPQLNQFQDRYLNGTSNGNYDASPIYVQQILDYLKQNYPNRTIVQTRTHEILYSIYVDIENDNAPWNEFSEIFRDNVHMDLHIGAAIVHNAMSYALRKGMRTANFSLTSAERNYIIEKISEFVILGDCNRDQSVDLRDVANFVDVLSSNDYDVCADVNQDGSSDLLDVADFVDLLTD